MGKALGTLMNSSLKQTEEGSISMGVKAKKRKFEVGVQGGQFA